MLTDLNKSQKVFFVIMYILTGISAVFGIFSFYTMITTKKPFTLGVTYADKLETELTGEVPVIELSVHSNLNDNGLPVYDMRINSYTDSEGNGIAGFGIQCVGDWKIINSSDYKKYSFKSTKYELNSTLQGYKDQYGGAFLSHNTGAFGDFYFYYTGDNGEIYIKTNLEEIPDYMLISMKDKETNENKYYRMTLKEYTFKEPRTDFAAIMLNWIPGVKTHDIITTKFSWFEIFDMLMDSAKNCSAGVEYEEFVLNLYDLSSFVNIEYLDSNGQYKELPNTSDNRHYFNVNVKYSLDGLQKSSDSMFKMVQASPSYDNSVVIEEKDYWKSKSVCYVTVNSLSYKMVDGVCIAYLDNEFAEYLKTISDDHIIYFNLYFDCCYLGFIVNGIDLSNFTFVNSPLNIYCHFPEDFIVLNKEACPSYSSLTISEVV